jgi:hypothetical protein
VEWFVPAPGSRTLAVEDAGDREGRPVMVHVGTPGGRRIPGVEAWFFDDEGHALRENHIADVHAWLVDHSS